MPTYVTESGLVDETPCPGCGWPICSCLCQDDDPDAQTVIGDGWVFLESVLETDGFNSSLSRRKTMKVAVALLAIAVIGTLIGVLGGALVNALVGVL